MRVLVLGSGGREHAMVRALSRSGQEIFWAPGNGAEGPWEILPVDLSRLTSVEECVLKHRPDLTLVGPEDPLAAGLADRLAALGFQTWGPNAAQARLESSKVWAKQWMARWQLPTAEFAVAESLSQAEQAIERLGGAVVVKADGLMAGKGVVVANHASEALEASRRLLPGPLVVERRLQGPEASLILLTRPDGYQAFPLVRDHKRLRDGDQGPNTGGMGAFFPIPEQPDLQPLLDSLWKALVADGLNYFGALFLGLMLTPEGPQLLEFNCRLGDPEAEVLLEALEGDLIEVLKGHQSIHLKPGCWLDLVLASAGYPESATRGQPITGLPQNEVAVLHAATRLSQGQLLTAGGRVLHLVAQGATLEEARTRVYAAAESIRFGGESPQFRRDLGHPLVVAP